jgi:CRISPR system Cascade subunit CasE
MILSRLLLNPRSRDVRRDIADCQQLHRTVMSAFPQVESDQARHDLVVLFRVEQDGVLPILLVQSQIEPEWDRIPAEYLAATDDVPNPDTKNLTAAWEHLKARMVLSFGLRANPTRKIETRSTAEGVARNGRRVELRTEKDQINWLRRKAEGGGFEILSVQTVPAAPSIRVTDEPKRFGFRVDRISNGGNRTRVKLTFASVLFEGELRISDQDKFRRTLEHGLGPAKAYGFGLLSVAAHRIAF